MDLPKAYEVYRHFKGDYYTVICVALDSETLTKKVVYKAMYGEGTVYVRDLSMFTSLVDKNKYPDSNQKYRFEKVDFDELGKMPATDKTSSETEKIAEEPVAEAPKPEVQSREKKDPQTLLIRFLDSQDNDERLDILSDMNECITEPMVSTMEFSLGMEEGKGSLYDRLRDIKQNILYKNKYELKHR